MSFNVAILSASAHLATQTSHAAFAEGEPGCGTTVPGFHPPRGLELPSHGHTSFDADGPWCGTRVPGVHPPLPHALQSVLNTGLLDKVALNPQPLPPKESGLSRSTSQFMDDEQCGSVPRHVFPGPPSPSPWTSAISVTALQPDVSGLVNGALGRQR